MKQTILHEPSRPLSAGIPLLDNTSLGLIFRDTKDKVRESFRILREHYIGKGRPRIVSLYITLTLQKKADTETVTVYHKSRADHHGMLECR